LTPAKSPSSPHGSDGQSLTSVKQRSAFMSKKTRSQRLQREEEMQLKTDIAALLRLQDSTKLARLLTHAMHALTEQIERMEIQIVCAAHFERPGEVARLQPWLGVYKSQLELVRKLQHLIVYHDAKK